MGKADAIFEDTKIVNIQKAKQLLKDGDYDVVGSPVRLPYIIDKSSTANSRTRSKLGSRLK